MPSHTAPLIPTPLYNLVYKVKFLPTSSMFAEKLASLACQYFNTSLGSVILVPKGVQ
ncbi:hypothetical protein oki361_25400 [Helicobacter pylori]